MVPFITVEEFQAYLKLSGPLYDTVLGDFAIQGGCQMVIDYLEQELILTETTVSGARVKADGFKFLQLPNFPIEEISAFTMDDSDVAIEDYEIMSAAGMLYSTEIDFSQTSSYSLTYTYGYAYDSGVDEIPPTCKVVATQVGMRIYEFAMYKAETIGPLASTYSEGGGQLTDYEKDALYPHRSYV